ncbi:MAG UNVERIFIED_CONTAM: hypothetical protein LVT10_23745 [Anaerolineae bacterium]|jgi:hypothetical protein
MKILVIHNTYRYAGGEEKVVERESDMLKQAGHTIIRYERSNSEFDDLSIGNLMRFPFESVWSNRTVQDLTELIEREQPDLAHIHNTHLMITPLRITLAMRWGYRLRKPITIIARCVRLEHSFEMGTYVRTA